MSRRHSHTLIHPFLPSSLPPLLPHRRWKKCPIYSRLSSEPSLPPTARRGRGGTRRLSREGGKEEGREGGKEEGRTSHVGLMERRMEGGKEGGSSAARLFELMRPSEQGKRRREGGREGGRRRRTWL